MDDDTLNSLRYTFQRILVPCVVIIGVLGNFVSVIVLTRRRMRCSTNVYLTALAVVDIIFLFFIFILSLEHYPNIHHSKYELYWRTFGLSHWFCDAASYTSIYLTVSFTVERYIAVCHPIRGQVLCTESRAKNIISVVVILCFLLTISTSFEYQLTTKTEFRNKTSGELCLGNFTSSVTENSITASVTRRNGEKHGEPNTSTIIDSDPCKEEYFLYASPSLLGMNTTYEAIFYTLTSVVFVFLPLILLATFNCFLIAAVHRSHRMRHKMTNTRRSNVPTAQENKITITLIAVVVLFLICQTPTAAHLIYISWIKPKGLAASNVVLALGNVLNFLITISAACNFLLYCALSDKYRQTVKSIFLGIHSKRQNTIRSSQASRNSTRSGRYGRYNGSTISRTRQTGSTHISMTPRASITPSEFSKFDVSRKNSVSSMKKETLVTNNTTKHLHPSPSQSSLQRSQSMTLRPLTRHSPDCKSNPNIF